jgi:thiol-disulfide isomerase/thioredoxin
VLDDWVSARTTAELTAVGTAVLAASSVALCVRFWRDNRRLRRDLAREREATVLFPPGLPQGARAPAFSLPDLRGETISLESLLARGQPVALVFVSPGCGPCAELMPELGRWQRTLAERLTIALLSSGSALDNHRAIEHGLTNVMLQPDADVMAAYRVTATPSVVIVSPDGRIASIAASGFPAVEPLIRLTLRGDVGRVPGVHLAAANGTRPKQPEPAR